MKKPRARIGKNRSCHVWHETNMLRVKINVRFGFYSKSNIYLYVGIYEILTLKKRPAVLYNSHEVCLPRTKPTPVTGAFSTPLHCPVSPEPLSSVPGSAIISECAGFPITGAGGGSYRQFPTDGGPEDARGGPARPHSGGKAGLRHRHRWPAGAAPSSIHLHRDRVRQCCTQRNWTFPNFN